MTFLQLCQYVQRYIAAGNDLPGSGNPTTVAGQTGLYLEIVGWVQDAYRDIQQEESSWLFRQASGSLALTSGTASYSKATIQGSITDYERILPYRNGDIQFITAHNSVGPVNANCYYIPFDKWGGVVSIGFAATPTTGLPTYFTVKPDEGLQFWPIPDATTYSAAFQYTRTVQELVVDADVPIWPSEWHDAIAWRAIRYWAIVRESANKYQLADAELQRVMGAMRATQLLNPPPTLEPIKDKETP